MSESKRLSNRRNAQRSTGPRTSAGKKNASRNALRHGLAVPVCADPVLSVEVENLALALAGQHADAVRLALARGVAEAQVDSARIQTARTSLFGKLLSKIEGYSDKLLGPDQRDISGLTVICRQLKCLDRYERRAFSREAKATKGFLLHHNQLNGSAPFRG